MPDNQEEKAFQHFCLNGSKANTLNDIPLLLYSSANNSDSVIILRAVGCKSSKL
jgi:hypothetical protein